MTMRSARKIDGRSVAAIEADPVWDEARDASVARNADTCGEELDVVAVLGVVNETAGEFTEVFGTAIPTAVRWAPSRRTSTRGSRRSSTPRSTTP